MKTLNPSQTILPESYAVRVQAALERVAGQQLIQRLWEKDASLWTSNPTEGRMIRQRLGWLTIVSVMEAQITSIQAFAQEIRQEGFTHALLLGMGGSSLFSEVCRFTFGVAPGWLDLAVLDSTDPTAIATATQRAPLERTLVIVSSKSGTTPEVNALCSYFYDQIRQLKAKQAGRRFIAITDVGTPLEATAKAWDFRRAFVHGPTTGQDVGGRFSALTYFGLVPAALIGVDIRNLLARAKAMLATCDPTVPLQGNSAAQLGVCFGETVALGRDKVTLLSSEPLAQFGLWVEQLLAESTGKSGKGLIPIHGESLRDPGAYSPDRLFVELQLRSALDPDLEQAVMRLAKAGHPVVRLRWQDRYDLGGEAIRWFLATTILAHAMQINPFDEPDVQASKDRTQALLGHFAREGQLLREEPLITEGDLAIYGNRQAVSACSFKEILRGMFQQVRMGDYVALLSFLPRTRALDTAVGLLRNRLAETLGVATMLGYGPRYLHSTGQLYKGGPDRGVFLLLMAEDPVDLPVPEQPYTFSVIKQAQAIGDFQALQERHRRILLLHLGKSPEAALPRLLGLMDEIVTSPMLKRFG